MCQWRNARDSETPSFIVFLWGFIEGINMGRLLIFSACGYFQWCLICLPATTSSSRENAQCLHEWCCHVTFFIVRLLLYKLVMDTLDFLEKFDSIQKAIVIWYMGDNIVFGWTKAIWTIRLLQQPYENAQPTLRVSIHSCGIFLSWNGTQFKIIDGNSYKPDREILTECWDHGPPWRMAVS